MGPRESVRKTGNGPIEADREGESVFRMKAFAMKRPLIFTFLILVFFILSMSLIYPATIFAGFLGEAIVKMMIAMVLIVILAGFKWSQQSGLTTVGNKRGWLITSVLLILLIPFQLYAFTGTIWLSLPEPKGLVNLATGLFAGSFLEELLFRGLIFSVMLSGWQKKKHGILMALSGSSFVFGIVHFLNLGFRSFEVVFIQVIVLMFAGMMYGALVLISQSIWPAVVVHWLTNLAVNLAVSTRTNYQETVFMWLIFFAGLVPILIFLIWQLRNEKDTMRFDIE